MKSLYAANGFLSATIVGSTPSDQNKGELLVRFEISEGKQTLVSSLKLEGMSAMTEEELRGVLGSLPGQPYSEVSIASDRDNILALYFNRRAFRTRVFRGRRCRKQRKQVKGTKQKTRRAAGKEPRRRANRMDPSNAECQWG